MNTKGQTKKASKKKAKNPTKDKKIANENIYSIDEALEKGYVAPDYEAKHAVKIGDKVIWIPKGAGRTPFPGLLTEKAKFMDGQIVSIPIGYHQSHWIGIDLGQIILEEAKAQYHYCIAAQAKNKKVANAVKKKRKEKRGERDIEAQRKRMSHATNVKLQRIKEKKEAIDIANKPISNSQESETQKG